MNQLVCGTVPFVQILWVAENWTAASGSLKLVRGLGVSISAISLTIDTKKRYASKTEEARYCDAFASALFKIVNGVCAFGMGIICVALLTKGAVDLNLAWYFFVIYCVFIVIWTAASFAIWPVQDGGIKGFGIVPDVLMGAFAGLFLGAPAFAEQPIMTSGGFLTPDSGQASLKKYLSCEKVAVWQKFVAIFP